MKQNVSISDFRDWFNGSDYEDNFTHDGLEALYEWIIELEEDTGEEMEFDPIALCCEFTEYTDLEELQCAYQDIGSMEELEQHTIVIPIPGTDSFIIQAY